jgi:mono/diheme cytochrome c family protein
MRPAGFAAVTMLISLGCRASQPPQSSAAQTQPALSRADQLLLAAAKVALPPSGVAAGDLPDPQSRGAQLVIQYCSQCHSLPTPTMHSATDWPSVARRMWLRMEMLPASVGVKVPSASDRYTILTYLLANSLKVSGSVLPAGKGRDEFAIVCSQCHAVPDPRVHSPQDWPAVYSRMERNMERMGVRPPTATQTGDILLYLQSQGQRRPTGN